MGCVPRLSLIALLVAVGLALPSTEAFASCAEANPVAQTARADVIAYGTLTGIRMTFAPASPVVTFRPERVLKGTLTTSVEVFFGPTHGGALSSVDYSGAPPETHTLYLRLSNGSYEADACSGSHSGPPTADEERLLGHGSDVTVPDMRSWLPVVVVGAVVALGIAAILMRRRRRPS